MFGIEILRNSKIVVSDLLQAQSLGFLQEEERCRRDHSIKYTPEKERAPDIELVV